MSNPEVALIWLRASILSILPSDLKPSEVGDEHPLVKALNPSLDDMIRSRSKEIFVEEELARRR